MAFHNTDPTCWLPIMCQELRMFTFGPDQVGIIILTILQVRIYPVAMLTGSSQVPYVSSPCSSPGNVLSMLLRITRDLYKHHLILSKRDVHSNTHSSRNENSTWVVGILWDLQIWHFVRVGETAVILASWVQKQKIQDWDFALPFMSCVTFSKSFNLPGTLFPCLWIMDIKRYCIGEP